MRRKVLLVDDDEDVRRTYGDLIESAGYDVALAATGERAIEMVDARPPDVIVLDIGLPGRDGIQIARELSGRRIPILMMTGLSEFSVGRGVGDIEAIRTFLYKPCRAETLLKGIGDALGP